MAKPEVTPRPAALPIGVSFFLAWKTRAPPAPSAGFAEGNALGGPPAPQPGLRASPGSPRAGPGSGPIPSDPAPSQPRGLWFACRTPARPQGCGALFRAGLPV